MQQLCRASPLIYGRSLRLNDRKNLRARVCTDGRRLTPVAAVILYPEGNSKRPSGCLHSRIFLTSVTTGAKLRGSFVTVFTRIPSPLLNHVLT